MARNPVNDAEKLKNTKIEPRTETQRKYINGINNHAQTFAIGPAGSGKTFVPVMMAMDLYLKGKIKKIIVSRPAVEVEESHGFLPGDINKKLAPWVLPIVELIEEVVGKERSIKMQKDGDFEVAPFAYMRGRTFNNAFVILDEAQNTTVRQMEMFLTRLGQDSKVVISGDLNQTDMQNGNCGLALAVQMVETYNIPAAIIRFTSEDVVRSEVCKMWVEAFEKLPSFNNPVGILPTRRNHR